MQTVFTLASVIVLCQKLHNLMVLYIMGYTDGSPLAILDPKGALARTQSGHLFKDNDVIQTFRQGCVGNLRVAV